MTSNAVSEPVVIVSNDTHVGPRLIEDLRPYCPSSDIDEFDRFAAMTAEQRQAAEQLPRQWVPRPSELARPPGTTTRARWPTTTTTASPPVSCSTVR